MIDNEGLFPENHLPPDAAHRHIVECNGCFGFFKGAGLPARIADGGGVEQTGGIHLADKSEVAGRNFLGDGQTGPGDGFTAVRFERFGEKTVDGGEEPCLPCDAVLRLPAFGHVVENGNHLACGKPENVVVRPEGLLVVRIIKGGMLLGFSRLPHPLKCF